MSDLTVQGSGRSPRRKPAYFTICATNSLQFAITLGNSLKRADPDAEFIVFLADEPSDLSKWASRQFKIVPCRQVGIPDYDDMAFKYSILEFNTSVKPFCFDHVFDVLGHTSAIYLDPDIFVLKPLAEVEAALAGGASCVLTPHATQPVSDGKSPDDYSFLLCGGFNLGFIALNSSEEARRFNRWWAEKLRLDCFVALERGVFVDQKYLDLAPSFIDKLKVLRHPGYNVAYWNLVQRTITEINGEFFANGEPLHFVHFSGIDLSDRECFSRHQSRYARRSLSKDFQRVFDDYFDRLTQNDAATTGQRYSSASYAYGHFKNGVAITPILRRLYNRYRTTSGQLGNPFDFDTTFFLARSDAVPSFVGMRISRLQHEIWKDRVDLLKLFDPETREGQAGFLDWAAKSVKREYGLPDALIERAPDLPAVVRPASQGNLEDLLRRALTSRSFMLKSFLRRQFRGKAQVLDHWRLRGYALSSGGAPRPQPVDAILPPPEARPTSLSIHGHFQLETGTGQIARGFARAMLAAGHPVSCHSIQIGDERFERREPFPSSNSHFSTSTCALICLNADATSELDHHIPPAAIASKYRIGHWVWELAELPDQWLGSLAKVDEIWTPTRFVADAVQKKTRKPVKVVPYMVDRSEQSTVRARSAFGLPRDRLLVLMALDYNSFAARKNPTGAVRAFLDAFDGLGPSSPLLVVKYHGQKGADAGLKALIGPRRDVVVIDEVLSDSEMCTLQNACDIFLSAHRAEGFGLNIAECMRLGKLAIATGYSGNQDFMTASNSIPLPYDLIPVGKDEYVFGEGQQWADPKHDDIVDALRWGVHHYEKTEPLRSQAKRDITLKFSSEAIGRRMIVALNDR